MTHMTKSWFEDGKLITQFIPPKEIYKREWVGLTDEEIKDIELGIEIFGLSVKDVLKEAEAKLKEKNT